MLLRMTIPLLLYGFSSCTCLYEWLSISFEWVFVMYIFVRMTTISFWMDCRHAHFCTNDYHFFLNGMSLFTYLYEWLPFLFEWIVVIYISVRMTNISFWMDCRHAHFCTNDYHFVVYGFLSSTFCANEFPYSLYRDFRHGNFCANDFPYSFVFSMCVMLFNSWITWSSDEL